MKLKVHKPLKQVPVTFGIWYYTHTCIETIVKRGEEKQNRDTPLTNGNK